MVAFAVVVTAYRGIGDWVNSVVMIVRSKLETQEDGRESLCENDPSSKARLPAFWQSTADPSQPR